MSTIADKIKELIKLKEAERNLRLYIDEYSKRYLGFWTDYFTKQEWNRSDNEYIFEINSIWAILNAHSVQFFPEKQLDMKSIFIKFLETQSINLTIIQIPTGGLNSIDYISNFIFKISA